MGHEIDLSENEKSLIIQKTANCVLIKAIANELGCYQRTTEIFDGPFLEEEEVRRRIV